MFSKLKNLFNSNSSAVGVSDYKDFQIVPTPKKIAERIQQKEKYSKKLGV